jgi:hypothetical protein
VNGKKRLKNTLAISDGSSLLETYDRMTATLETLCSKSTKPLPTREHM